jgi:pseudouridine-5'-phosphate glycosidase
MMETNIDYRNNSMHVNTRKVRGKLITDFLLCKMVGEVQGQILENIYVKEETVFGVELRYEHITEELQL